MPPPLLRSRVLAAAIDTAIAYLLLTPIPILLTWQYELFMSYVGNWWDGILLWGFVFHALYILLSHLVWGRTLGKRIAGLSVVSASPGRVPRTVVRETVRAVSILIVVMGVFFFPIAGIAAVMSRGWAPPGAIFPAEFIIFGYLVLFGPPLAAILIPLRHGEGERALHDHLADTVVATDGEAERYAAALESASGPGQTAEAGVRTGAAVIDVLAVGLPAGAAAIIIYLTTGHDTFLLLFYPAFLAYNVLMHAASGATLGKQAYGLVVTGVTGSWTGWIRAFAREAVRTLPLGVMAILADRTGFDSFSIVVILPFSGLLTIAVVCLSDSRLGFHDFVARTKVVRRSPPH